MSDERLLTYAELSEWFRVPVATLRDWRARGPRWAPPAIKVGGQVRFRRSEVEAWLESRRDQ